MLMISHLCLICLFVHIHVDETGPTPFRSGGCKNSPVRFSHWTLYEATKSEFLIFNMLCRISLGLVVYSSAFVVSFSFFEY